MMILKKPIFILTILSLVFALALAVPQSALAVPGECPAYLFPVAYYDWAGGWVQSSTSLIDITFSPAEEAGPYQGLGPDNYVGHWDSGSFAIDAVVITDGHEGGGPGSPVVAHTYFYDPAVTEDDYNAYLDLLDESGDPRGISNIVFCSDGFVVSLAAFSARASRGVVAIDWVTATEIDNAGFMLYRSTTTDGPRAQMTSLIAAQGNGLTGASYRVNDTPGYGTFYYWLQDVDLSGKTSLHGPVVVTVFPSIRLPFYRPSLPGQ